MATERPPQTPGKDYNKYEHHTPDADDDGWGSDFDSEHESFEEEENDDEYEEPQQQQPTMPHSTAAMTSHHANSRTPHVTPPETPVIPSRRPLPKEPPKYEVELENYEDPHAPEPEDYEEPIDRSIPLRPPPRQHPGPHTPPRRHSPPSLPNTIPPRIPPRVEEPYEIDNKSDSEEDYEKPEKHTSYIGGHANRSEVVSVSGPLKPSNVAKQKTNYTKVEVAKPEAKSKNSWLNPNGEGIPVKPSQLKDLQGRSPILKDQPPPIPSNKHKTPVLKSPVSDRPSAPPSSDRLPAPSSLDRIPTPPSSEKKHPAPPSSERPPVVPSSDRPVTKAAWNYRGLPKAPEEEEMEGLYSYTWYHGDLKRDKATERLEAKSKNGMFLVRKSTRDGSPYALSLYFGGRVYNLNIRLRSDNKYALGIVKEDEKSFSTVPSLINYFQNNTLVLGGNTATITTLKQSLPK